MRDTHPAALRIRFNQIDRGVRRLIEYVFAIGAALLASYVILQGHW